MSDLHCGLKADLEVLFNGLNTQKPFSLSPMVTALARVLICLTLLVAGTVLFAMEKMELALFFAGGLALAGLWMLRHRALKPSADEREHPINVPVQANLVEVLWRCTQRMEQCPSLDDALLAVRQVIEEELGAMGVRTMRVESNSVEAAWVRVIEPVFAEIEGYRPVAVSLPLSRFPIGVAIRQQQVVGDPVAGYAAPVCDRGQTVAVLEVASTTLECTSQAMHQFLCVLTSQLAQFHIRGLVGFASASGASETGTPITVLRPALEPVNQFGTLMQALPEAALLFDVQDLTLLDLNAAAEQQFSVSRAHVLGKDVHQVFHPALAALAVPTMRAAVQAHALNTTSGQTVMASDYEWSTSADMPQHICNAHFQNVVINQNDGQARWLLVVARDMTLERRAQRELSETQALLHQFADTVEESLFVTNPERTQFHFLAGSLFDVWGVTRGRMAAEPGCLLKQVIEEDQPVIAERMAVERAGRPGDFAFRIHHPTKGRRWLRSRTRTLVLPDGQQRVYGTVCDVTEDKKREIELRSARDAAESASMAKSQFLANMSHEIRTPMNGILGMTELLLGTPLHDNQKRFAQAVYRSGESLLEIINDILDFSKIEAGKLELALSDFSLRGVVEDTLELLAPRAHAKGLDIGFREEPGMPMAAHGDALRLRQVLTNLVANAIKFTHAGEVVVDLHRLPEGGGNDYWVEFKIRDTGIGIEPDKLPELFNAFTQVSCDMSRRYGGTGLGLAISKQLVEIMGGQLRVISSPGQGSEFSFSLQLQPARGPTAEVSLEDAQMPALQVLVVDDHMTNRTVLKNMLGAWGMTVTLAEDGQQALDMLSDPTHPENRFDLALVDMHMPRLDGMALARALTDQGLLGGMRMVLLSSVSSPDDASAALAAGFHRFLPKPIRKAELRQTIAGLWAAKRETEDGLESTQLLTGNVLVVEDNPVNQEVIGQMLRSLGLRVQIVSGGMHGLRSLCEAHFDLVLMDIMMPGMDGVAAVGWFRRGSGTRFRFKTPSSTPVIAVTANALEGDEERFLSLGFNDYLSKPFRQNQLFAMLTRYLRPQPAMPIEPGSLGHQSAPAPLPAVAVKNSQTATAGQVLDQEALQRLRELDPNGQNKLIQRVVAAFETSMARMVPQVQQASRNNDRDGMRHVAHTLKSSSASIGALRLSKMCADLESIIRLERGDDTSPHVEAICREVDVVLIALRELEPTVAPVRPCSKPALDGLPGELAI